MKKRVRSIKVNVEQGIQGILWEVALIVRILSDVPSVSSNVSRIGTLFKNFKFSKNSAINHFGVNMTSLFLIWLIGVWWIGRLKKCSYRHSSLMPNSDNSRDTDDLIKLDIYFAYIPKSVNIQDRKTSTLISIWS